MCALERGTTIAAAALHCSLVGVFGVQRSLGSSLDHVMSAGPANQSGADRISCSFSPCFTRSVREHRSEAQCTLHGTVPLYMLMNTIVVMVKAIHLDRGWCPSAWLACCSHDDATYTGYRSPRAKDLHMHKGPLFRRDYLMCDSKPACYSCSYSPLCIVAVGPTVYPSLYTFISKQHRARQACSSAQAGDDALGDAWQH